MQLFNFHNNNYNTYRGSGYFQGTLFSLLCRAGCCIIDLFRVYDFLCCLHKTVLDFRIDREWWALNKNIFMEHEEFAVEWCIRGYHIYKEVWAAVIGEDLPCERELGNPEDN